MDDTEWVKLRFGNDWGRRYLAVEPLDTGCAHFKRGIVAKEGESVLIRWPDGNVEHAVITKIMELAPTSREDVGSSYPEVVVNLHGGRIQIPLTQVEVQRSWVDAHTPGRMQVKP